jgi:hypothetical protein
MTDFLFPAEQTRAHDEDGLAEPPIAQPESHRLSHTVVVVVQVAQALLGRHADPNIADKNGETALFKAANNGTLSHAMPDQRPCCPVSLPPPARTSTLEWQSHVIRVVGPTLKLCLAP